MENATVLAALHPKKYAFFFDLDGTLAELQPQPTSVKVDPEVITALSQLLTQSEGAIALISGRPLTELDLLVAPLSLVAAGVHGAEHRTTSGEIRRITLPAEKRNTLAQRLQREIAKLPGVRLEDKGNAFALHYRAAPHQHEAVCCLAEQSIDGDPSLTVQHGKCVVEIKPAVASKGAAINHFMNESPFSGRLPVFIGDDCTDESGFKAVNLAGGVSIKVGEGQTVARYRISNVTEVTRWLSGLVSQF